MTNARQNPQLGFAKICFAVPDLDVCLERIKSHDVKFLKQAHSIEGIDVVSSTIGAESPTKGRNKSLWDSCRPVAFVEDPDGYVVELVQY